MFQRIKGIMRLDVNTFEEVEADEGATMQAAIIVTVVALLAGVGALIGARAANSAAGQLDQLGIEMPITLPQFSPAGAFVNAVVGVFVAWLLWSVLTYFIGTRLFGGKSSINEMLRVLGYAQSPNLLRVFSFIPCLGPILGLVGAIWSIVTGFIGVRQGLDLDNTKALLTIVASWLVSFLVNWLLLGPIFARLLAA